jgi:hypothetical protein
MPSAVRKKSLSCFDRVEYEKQLLLSGKLLSIAVNSVSEYSKLADLEFKVFSQWGDDGIIQWLVSNVPFENTSFVEFGVEDYRESNTRFLMFNNNWSGFIVDGSKANVDAIIDSEYYWKCGLTAKAAFITKDNINSLLESSRLSPNVGILHIDLDGIDYWIWKEISAINPALVILEYNSVFGIERSITVPYC